MRHDKTPREGGGPEHDSGYKLLFSHRQMVQDLCRGFLPELGARCLDFATLERAASSFVDNRFRERHGDLVWRLGRRDEPRPVFLLLEFQSTPDPIMPLRLLGYVSLLLQDMIRNGRHKPSDELPVVLPVVLYNGRLAWRAPLQAAGLFGVLPSELRRYAPDLHYVLLDEKELDLERPDLADNLAAAIFRIETCDVQDFRRLLHEILDLATREQDMELRSSITAWLRRKCHRVLPGSIITPGLEDATMLEESIIRWEKEFLQQGRREGEREGMIKGMRLVLLGLLRQRFGRLPARVRQSVEAIQSERELQRVARRVLEAKSFAELGLS
ncbi:MAG: Rpn family recombination-promoting nuclease/putative transposase [Acidobacteria bacterium]|nr:Rpn family recombination-promoting nuclease/putative transposase [Acidobacteriota bacterium]